MKIISFWEKDARGNIKINEHLLLKFLRKKGFYIYNPVQDFTTEPQFLYRNVNIIEPVNPIWIHNMVINKIESGLVEEGITPFQCKSKSALISELIDSRILTRKEFLVLLKQLDRPIISDTKDSAYLFFKNNGVKVTKDGIELFQIATLDKYVWKSQIIDRDFELKSLEEVKGNSDYYKFLRNVTSIKSKGKWEVNNERLDNLITLQGYLLHGYKDRANAKAVALMDSSEIGVPSGRTGKGLFANGLSKLKKTILEDGKSFKDDNRFRFSQVTPDTKILFINDVKENFNFENIFPTITDGINVEVKFENKKTIPFEESPKIVISTNYAILGRGSSFEDRIYEFELSNYYSKDYRPNDDFNQYFFEEWDTDQWNLFYSLMLYSVKEYLNKGVVRSEGINLKRNKLISETNKPFVEWILNSDIKSDQKYSKKTLFNEFSDLTGNNPYTGIAQLIFTKYLKTWAHYNNLVPVESHSNVDLFIEFKSK